WPGTNAWAWLFGHHRRLYVMQPNVFVSPSVAHQSARARAMTTSSGDDQASIKCCAPARATPEIVPITKAVSDIIGGARACCTPSYGLRGNVWRESCTLRCMCEDCQCTISFGRRACVPPLRIPFAPCVYRPRAVRSAAAGPVSSALWDPRLECWSAGAHWTNCHKATF
ncbi:hypothetical protein BJ912DRAFT_938562, partial [Pholiota molesta]